MNKTITFDSDVAAKIQKEADAAEWSFSKVVNRKLRVALGLQPVAKPRKPKVA